MRLVVLGSGTLRPSGTRGSSGYWVEAGDARIRLDCGAGSVHAMARHKLPWETLTHQFISHFHIDHAGELPALLVAMRWGRSAPRDTPLELLGPAGLRALVEGLAALYDEKLTTQQFPLLFEELPPGARHRLTDGVELRVAKTPHTKESLAVRIEHAGRSLGYTGDTVASPALADFFLDVDLLIAECSFLDDRRGTNHLTADDAADLATSARAKLLVATHSYFDPEQAGLADRLAKKFHGPIAIATDGAEFEI
jgi:ribonuclease BN (tRNA processing enzyme)